MTQVASEVTYTFTKHTHTIIKVKGFESGNSFAFIPATIDITVSGVRKTIHDVYFPFKIGAHILQTEFISFATANKYGVDRTEANSKVNVYTT